MSKLDIYYKAFVDYRKETINDTSCQKDRLAFKKNGVEFDKLQTSKFLCTIEDDWIKAIEEGLVFIEKAVAEERQFIRTNSEVVPIEKVKKIAKQTIDHLARHSEFITHVPENEDDNIIPDKLLMVEKLSDYAVYENRFLYMLLCYLRDFINLRLEKIEDLRRSYKSIFNLDKEVHTKKRTYHLTTSFTDERTDNEFPLPDDKSAKQIVRIKDCLQFVVSMLNRPLMVEVAKSPMVKPPIVKTNVLKMNNNFKGALALYDYIVSYNSLGFTSKEVVQDFDPFSEKIADEVAEILNITSFLSYKYGNDLEDMLKANYQAELQRLAEEEKKKLLEQIKRLKKRVAEEGYSPEEYMLLLEKRNNLLEQDSQDLKLARKEIARMTETISNLEKEKQEYLRQIEDLHDTIEQMKIAHQNEIAELKANHEKEITELKTNHENEVKQLNENYTNQINNINETHRKEIVNINKNHEIERNRLNARASELINENKLTVEKHNKEIVEFNNKISDLNNQNKQTITDYEAKIEDINRIHNAAVEVHNYDMSVVIEEKNLYKAELHALRIKSGLKDNEDYTSKEKITELENDFLSFNAFFKKNWALTKKKIRKELLWIKEEKSKTDKK